MGEKANPRRLHTVLFHLYDTLDDKIMEMESGWSLPEIEDKSGGQVWLLKGGQEPRLKLLYADCGGGSVTYPGDEIARNSTRTQTPVQPKQGKPEQDP